MVNSVFQDSAASSCQPCVPLQLISLCDGSWRVVNANPVSYAFTWSVTGTVENGAGVVGANSNTTFTTSGCAANGGSMAVQLYVGGVLQDMVGSNCLLCSPPVTTTTTTTVTATTPPETPITTTTTTGTTTTAATTTTATNTTGVTTQTTTTGPDGGLTIPLFLLIGGAGILLLIPIVLFILYWFRWVASDEDSIRMLRQEDALNKLRRIVVPDKLWELLQREPDLKGALDDAGVKIKVQQVESGSPVIVSLMKRFRLHVLSAQAVEAARLKDLKYAWVEGKLINAKKLLKEVEAA